MEKIEQDTSTPADVLEYLKDGSQTVCTEIIREKVKDIKGGFTEKMNGVLGIVSKLPVLTEGKNDLFRKRTAEQILQNEYITGCTDAALAFITLSRALGIPARYVETIDRTWLQDGGENITGHVYVKVFDGNEWKVIDPMKRVIGADIEYDGRVVFKEGLDSWGIGIDSFDTLSKAFNDFRILHR